jgi:hypothetical protein
LGREVGGGEVRETILLEERQIITALKVQRERPIVLLVKIGK